MRSRLLLFILLLSLGIIAVFWSFRDEFSPRDVETLVSDLNTPWGMVLLPDESLLFTQRGGKISLLEHNQLFLIAQLNVSEESESGLHGIAIDPDFEQTPYIYVYYTTYDTGNRVSRFLFNAHEKTLHNETILLEHIPNARFHDGGRIAFGPDNFLYITTGDATDPGTAQDTSSLAGKILRMHRDGSVPEDNPFGNYVYSYGHRNPQGLAWDSQGNLYASEHGPTRHDEINRIVKGGNYGWPQNCDQQRAMNSQIHPETILPLRCFEEFTLAPAGLAWHKNSLYVAGLRGTQIRRLQLENDKIIAEGVFIDNFGRVRDVIIHDNYLYAATSNRDGRGVPIFSDDRIIRIQLQ